MHVDTEDLTDKYNQKQGLKTQRKAAGKEKKGKVFLMEVRMPKGDSKQCCESRRMARD